MLEMAIERIEESFPALENRPFPVRVSVGFPLGQRKAKGACQVFPHTSSADHTVEIFINPVIGDLSGAVSALIEGLALAVADCDKRSKRYRSAMSQIEAAAANTVDAIVSDLPDYPHASMDVAGRKKQGTRMRKIECPTCGFIARMTNKWMDQLDDSSVCMTGCGTYVGSMIKE